jgi:hypothetical protein
MIQSWYDRDPILKFWKAQGLPVRAVNALANGGLKNWEDVRNCGPDGMRIIPDIGNATMSAVEQAMISATGQGWNPRPAKPTRPSRLANIPTEELEAELRRRQEAPAPPETG